MVKNVVSAVSILVAGLVFTLSIPSLSIAQYVSPDFVDLAKKLKPTVVNIRTAKIIKPKQRMQRPRTQSPFDNFFEDFFGQHDQMPQQRPRREQSLGTG
ncbi:MAG: peptidase, partial [Verrucomicrobia bacterium]|nr:peptidase [Deltaproteobacteria bacterium]